MVTMLHLVALLGAMLCKYTIRDVGFVFLGEPLVTVHDGGIVERSGDGATRLFPSIAPLDGGAFRLALAQDLLDDVAMVLVLPGDDAPRIEAAAQDAVNRLHAMSDQGRLARPLDGPVGVAPFHVTADPIGAWAMGWAPEADAGAVVLYGRGRLAGSPLLGSQATADAILVQLELVTDSCECDRPRTWMTAPSLPLPWDDTLRTRARDVLGFDPHSPRVADEMDRMVARGPGGGDRAGTVGELAIDDPLLGYEEVVLTPVAPANSAKPAATPAAVAVADTHARFGTALFWLVIGLVGVAVIALGMQLADRGAA